jgi:hypothetical protein
MDPSWAGVKAPQRGEPPKARLVRLGAQWYKARQPRNHLEATEMQARDTLDLTRLRTPLAMMAIFCVIALVLWRTTGNAFYLFNFGYIGIALGIGIGVYGALPRKRKPQGRRLAQFLVGLYMLGFLGLIRRENMQIEGFWFYLLSGTFAGSTIHYLVAKVVGPLVFNRGWCGWACWTAMVLDLLPHRRRTRARPSGALGYLRYAHFALSLAVVLVLWFVFRYRADEQSFAELSWLAGGNVLYYAIGIGLAFALRDNRAFCKYICPIPALMKITSRFALLKISGDGEKCISCGACDRACPMDIPVSDCVGGGRRVMSTECIMCVECVDACRHGALDATFGVDRGAGG